MAWPPLQDHEIRPAHKKITPSLTCISVTFQIDLADNWLEGDGCKVLAMMMVDNGTIVNLGMANNRIGSQGAAAIAEMLDNNITLKV